MGLFEGSEHRHPGRANPAVLGAGAELEQFERAVYFSERGMNECRMQVLDVLGLRASFQFAKAGPGFLDASGASAQA